MHLISEAERLAFADRNRYVADPDFVTVDSAAMLDPDYLHRRAALIGAKSMGRAEAGRPRGATMTLADDRSPELPSTTQIAVVDGFGNALAMTSTIENGFGAQIMVRGFLLNNQLTDFSFVPEENGAPVANRVQAGKRPRSSMAPLLVFERDSGAFEMALGSPGGAAIIAYVAVAHRRARLAARSAALDRAAQLRLAQRADRTGAGASQRRLQRALHERGHEIRIQPLTSGAQGIQRAAAAGSVRRIHAARAWRRATDTIPPHGPQLSLALILLLLVLDPLGGLPIYIPIMNSVPKERRRPVALREASIAFAVLLGFMFGGEAFLRVMHLSERSLEVAGGVILLMVAIRMIFGAEGGVYGTPEGREPFIFPLAVPLLAGLRRWRRCCCWPAPARARDDLGAGADRRDGDLRHGAARLRAHPAPAGRLGGRGAREADGLVLTAIAVEMILAGLKRYFLG